MTRLLDLRRMRRRANRRRWLSHARLAAAVVLLFVSFSVPALRNGPGEMATAWWLVAALALAVAALSVQSLFRLRSHRAALAAVGRPSDEQSARIDFDRAWREESR